MKTTWSTYTLVLKEMHYIVKLVLYDFPRKHWNRFTKERWSL